MRFKHTVLCIILFLNFVNETKAQETGKANTYRVVGRIKDASTNEALIGASVSYADGKGTLTDTAGYYYLNLQSGNYILKINYIGYQAYTQRLTVENSDIQVKEIQMQGSNTLDEVEVAADIARTRETPIAFSDINAKQITEELGANDITMLLNTTPGAYASQQGGGAGDSRVNIRGFDQRNVAVMVDGIPVNDMENGQVFWSNWQGLSEVTKKMQVQRGLGASRLALPSVGGVMNIITKSVDQKQSFTIKSDMGTANYHRFAFGYNSGLIRNKFGITLSGSYTEGDGYIDRTWQKAWSYFGKISYKINNKNLLIFGFNGAPQSHGQRSFAINMVFHDKQFAERNGINADSVYALTTSATMNKYTNAKTGARGIQYSPDWGLVNGKELNAKINYFHKPLFNLSYFLNINSRFSFSNVLYLSLGNGGGTTLSSFPQYDKAGNGQLSMQGLYDANFSTPTSTLLPGLRPSSFYVYSSVNQHKWVGTLSTIKYKASPNLDFLGGLDARYYEGTHFQTPYNLLGGDFVISTSDLNMDRNPMSPIKYAGDKINYYYKSKISWLGLFGQGEYKTEKVSAFVTLTGNQNSYQNINYFAKRDVVLSSTNIIRNAIGYSDTLYTDGQNVGVKPTGFPIARNPDGSITFMDNLTNKNVTIGQNYTTIDNRSSKTRVNTSAVKLYTGYTAKGGFNYKINLNHNVFANIGHMNQAPKYSNVYDRSGAEIKNVNNQLIYTGEIGYNVKYRKLAASVNAYTTSWKNKPLDFGLTSSKVDPETQLPIYYNVTGVDALMKGVELDLTYKPIKQIELKVFGMLADWRWNSGGTSYAFAENGTRLDSVVFNAKGVHLGNAPQSQLGTHVRFEPFKGFYLKLQYTRFDKMYAQFDPTKLALDTKTNKDYRQMDSWKMPAYGLWDLYTGYMVYSGKTSVSITASVNNLLNTVYMSDAAFSTTPDNYNALNSYGWIGLGRRFNIGVKIGF